ncbi:MAG: GNAT family N-acetyltransferase [Chloroflexota bacterium]|nr:GNAT family N-acetyltransferase [Chloroflexota bacterium]
MDSPDLRGRTVRLRPVTTADAEPLTRILADPAVARWWPNYDRVRVDEEIVADEPDTTHWVIERGDTVVGMIEAWEEPEAEYRHAGIDLFIDPDLRGRGIGPDAIRAVAGWLVDERGHHRMTIDPAAANEAAIRAYHKVGFRDVGVLRRYQLMADGSWTDGLLMEMLADELVR